VSGQSDDFAGLERFDDVDATGEAEMFVRFLERIEQVPDVVARRKRSYELLDVGPVDVVADVGSGLGTAASTSTIRRRRYARRAASSLPAGGSSSSTRTGMRS